MMRVKIYEKVLGFFKGDKARATMWMNIPNPMLGNISPDAMLRYGRGDWLMRFVDHALDENEPAP